MPVLQIETCECIHVLNVNASVTGRKIGDIKLIGIFKKLNLYQTFPYVFFHLPISLKYFGR